MLNEINENFIGVGKAVDSQDPTGPAKMSRGYGGTAILWNKRLDALINPLDFSNERIQGVEILSDQKFDSDFNLYAMQRHN